MSHDHFASSTWGGWDRVHNIQATGWTSIVRNQLGTVLSLCVDEHSNSTRQRAGGILPGVECYQEQDPSARIFATPRIFIGCRCLLCSPADLFIESTLPVCRFDNFSILSRKDQSWCERLINKNVEALYFRKNTTQTNTQLELF